MSQVSISEAARLVGRDRKTLYKDIKSGRLSATQGATGTRQVDIAELVRVYGELVTTGDSRQTVENPQQATDQTTELRLRLAVAEAQLEQLRQRLAEKDGHISDLRGTVRLLAGPKKEPWWKIW